MSDSSSDPDEEVLTVFRDVGDPHEPLTTREVADSLDCARRTAYNKLDSLAERDAIKTKKVGARGRIWWLSEQVVSEKQQFRTGTSQPIEQAPIDNSSERKHLARSRQIDRKTLGSLVRAVDDYAIFTLDSEGSVASWNAGAEQLKGYSTEDILGEHFSTFYTEDDRAAGAPEQNLQDAAANGSTEDEGWRVCADGSQFWASITILPSCDTDGELDRYVKVVHNLTEQKQREREVRHERTLLETMFERLC